MNDLQITEAGELLYQFFSKGKEDYDAVLKQAYATSIGKKGTLVIGLLDGQMIDDTLNSFLKKFSERFPSIETRFERYSFRELTDHLDAGELDAVITLDWELTASKMYEWLPLYQLPTLLVVPKETPEEKIRQHSLKAFSDTTYICVKENDSKIYYEKTLLACSRAGFVPKIAFVDTLRELTLTLEMGKGIAGINNYHMLSYSPNVRCIEVDEFEPQQFFLCIRKDCSNPCVGALKSVYAEVF